MKVKWLAHAAFLITSDQGTRIITDPYEAGGGLSYASIDEAADIVTVSHDHADHNNAAAVRESPQVVKGAGVKEVKGIPFKGIPTYHDESQGGQRGPNTIFCFAVDGMRLCHLGDLGHPLSKEQVSGIGEVDILFSPVGGFFTIDAPVAAQLCDSLKPKVVIPMHFKTAKCAYPIADVEDFLKGRSDVNRLDASEVEFKRENLPAATQTVVLKPAL